MMHIKNYFYLILIEEDTQAKMAKNQTTIFQSIFYFLFFIPTILVRSSESVQPPLFKRFFFFIY